jgi:hypothetical protein
MWGSYLPHNEQLKPEQRVKQGVEQQAEQDNAMKNCSS